MTTPQPQTTCPQLPTYSDLRKANLEKINKFYDGVLKDYNGISTSTASTANIQNLITSYNNQLKEINRDLVQQLQNGIDNLVDQYDTLKSKKTQYEDNINTIKDLKQAIKDRETEVAAKSHSANETGILTSNTRTWHMILLAINIVFLLINAGILVYMFYFMVDTKSIMRGLRLGNGNTAKGITNTTLRLPKSINTRY